MSASELLCVFFLFVLWLFCFLHLVMFVVVFWVVCCSCLKSLGVWAKSQHCCWNRGMSFATSLGMYWGGKTFIDPGQSGQVQRQHCAHQSTALLRHRGGTGSSGLLGRGPPEVEKFRVGVHQATVQLGKVLTQLGKEPFQWALREGLVQQLAACRLPAVDEGTGAERAGSPFVEEGRQKLVVKSLSPAATAATVARPPALRQAATAFHPPCPPRPAASTFGLAHSAWDTT